MRLFFALDLPDDVRHRPDPAVPDEWAAHLRRVPAESRHVTLAFLGDVPADRVPAIRAAVAALPPVGPIDLTPAGVGFFPPRGPPRVLVVHLSSNDDRLARRHASLELALARLGFEPERRPFRPHVTIARVRDPRRFPRDGGHALRAGPPGTGAAFRVETISLYSSTLTPDGASYTAVERWAL